MRLIVSVDEYESSVGLIVSVGEYESSVGLIVSVGGYEGSVGSNSPSVCLVFLDEDDLSEVIFSLIYNPMKTADRMRSSKNNTKKARRTLDGFRVSGSSSNPNRDNEIFAISVQIINAQIISRFAEVMLFVEWKSSAFQFLYRSVMRQSKVSELISLSHDLRTGACPPCLGTE